MLDFNYAEGIFEVMVGVSCCRNENNQIALERVWETNKQVWTWKEAFQRSGRVWNKLFENWIFLQI